MKAVTGACKLIDGCSLALCLAAGSVASSGTKIKSIQLHDYRDGPSHKIVSFTLHRYLRYLFIDCYKVLINFIE